MVKAMACKCLLVIPASEGRDRGPMLGCETSHIGKVSSGFE